MIAWIDSLRQTPRLRRRFEQLSPWLVIGLAAFLRLFELGRPSKLVFDETYYVKDGWSLFNTGAERTWPPNFDERFAAGEVMGFNPEASYVVHPPLGKWLIGLGMWLGGPQNAWSWRLSTALLGIALVGLVFVVGKRLFESHSWGLIAAFLLAIDGQAIVMSRVALLDGILAFVVFLAFYFLLRDREWVRLRFERQEFAASFARPWLLACGVTLGAASAVKWSGAYFLAAFGLYVVASDLLARRRYGGRPISLAAAGQAGINFLLMVPVAVAAYTAAWLGWFISGTGYGANRTGNALLDLWNFHNQAYEFHLGLRTPHTYQANPLSWLLLQRPTSMFYEGYADGEQGCFLPGGCSNAITALANPLIWYAAVVAILWVTYRWLLDRDSTTGLVLLGFAAGYLPWLLYINRTVFQFYTIAFEPWLILGLALGLRYYVRTREPGPPVTQSRQRVGYFFFAALLVTLFFLPIWTATEVPYWFWSIHMWVPGWI